MSLCRVLGHLQAGFPPVSQWWEGARKSRESPCQTWGLATLHSVSYHTAALRHKTTSYGIKKFDLNVEDRVQRAKKLSGYLIADHVTAETKKGVILLNVEQKLMAWSKAW